MKEDLYQNRTKIIHKLNVKRRNKISKIITNPKIKYKSLYWKGYKKYIQIPFDKKITKLLPQQMKGLYPKQRIVSKLNDSIQKIIRRKDANSKSM